MDGYLSACGVRQGTAPRRRSVVTRLHGRVGRPPEGHPRRRVSDSVGRQSRGRRPPHPGPRDMPAIRMPTRPSRPLGTAGAGAKAPPGASAVTRFRLTVTSNGGTRTVEVAARSEYRYEGGARISPVRWVFTKAPTEAHRDEYLFNTGPTLAADKAVGASCGRWSIATTFQECRPRINPGTGAGQRRHREPGPPSRAGRPGRRTSPFYDRHPAALPAVTPSRPGGRRGWRRVRAGRRLRPPPQRPRRRPRVGPGSTPRPQPPPGRPAGPGRPRPGRGR